jgi:hypothetical protein
MVGEVNGRRAGTTLVAGLISIVGGILCHPLAAEEFVGFKSALLGEDTPLRSAGPIKGVKERFKRVKLHQA